MKKAAIFIAALFLFSAGAFAQDLPRIAVYVTGNVGDDEKTALGTRMLASLINSGRYKGIERSNAFLAEIEREQTRQRSGAIDDGHISELGRQFGVKFICIANITPAFGEFQVSARIVNVETAEVDFIGDASSPLKSMADLVQVSNQVVKNMFGETAKTADEPKPEPAEPTPEAPAPKPETPATYSISLTANPPDGGAVSASPQKTAYTAGERVTLTAKPSKGYTFANWSGAAAAKNSSVVIIINNNVTLTANFQAKPEPTPKPKPEPGPKPEFKISAGGGAFLAYNVGGGIEWASGDKVAMPYAGGGAYLYADAVYIEAFAGYALYGGKWMSEDITDPIGKPNMTRSCVNLGAFAKYPLAIGQLTLFPLAGLEYETSSSEKLTYDDGTEHYMDPGALSALWLKLGAGGDVGLSKTLYLRAELLYGVRMANWFEIGEADSNGAETRPADGLTLKVGAGIKF